MNAIDIQPGQREKRISEFVDGEMQSADRQDVETLLAQDQHATEIHDELKRGAEHGRHLFDDMLKEPVPLDLVRSIKHAPLPRKAVRLSTEPQATSALRPYLPQMVAGGLLVAFLGTGLGYMIGMQPPSLPASLHATTTRDWMDDIVSHYRLYARQENRLVEIRADQSPDILQWLTTGTGVTFRIPDMADSGLSFLGARMIAAEGTPTGMLIYRRTDGDNAGDIIALTFSRARPETSKPVEDIRQDTGLVSWSTPIATYVLVGPSAAADLDDIAAKAAGLI